jgi:hypothetical protein
MFVMSMRCVGEEVAAGYRIPDPDPQYWKVRINYRERERMEILRKRELHKKVRKDETEEISKSWGRRGENI